MDEREELVATVHRLAWPGTGDLDCDEAGHPPGHRCLVLASPAEPARSESSGSSGSSGSSDLAVLQQALSERYGQPRALAMGGFADPSVTERTGLPLLAPFGDRILEMRAWAHASRWIGCGTARLPDGGVRTLALVAERGDPAADLAELTSWVDGVVAVTGWDIAQAPARARERARTVDWAAVEARIGTALPTEYKQLAELFGHGAFDEYLQMYVPDAAFQSSDIVRQAEWLGEWVKTNGTALWRPYEVYPTPGGVLEWGTSEPGEQFYWLTEGPDPDLWPVLTKGDLPDSWERFDGTTAEFVYRLLTDRQQPYSTARYFDTHWFDSYETDAQDGEG